MSTAIKAGNHWILRQKRAASRWADPAMPEYEPCWIVKLRMTGQMWERCREMPVTVLTRELTLDWMRLRQVWNLERELPEGRQRT